MTASFERDPVASPGLAAETAARIAADLVVARDSLRVVVHGSDGATVRPSDVGAVYWIGTAIPANATTADLWVTA